MSDLLRNPPKLNFVWGRSGQHTTTPTVTPKKAETLGTPKFFPIDTRAVNMIKDQTNNSKHKLGATKLEEIEFDPIDRLVEQIAQIDSILSEELGEDKKRASAIVNLLNSKIRIFETLLPYAYGKVPTTTNLDVKTEEPAKPLEIRLTFDEPPDTSTS